MPFDPDKFLAETQPPQSTGFDPDKFLAETAPPEVPLNKGREADLGTMNRLQYSIEPLESNRKAFLTQQFGAENVKEDDTGEVYLKQQGEWRPVNKDGLSLADGADFVGAIPEMAGAGIAGFAGGATTAGVGTIPSAMAGAGVGSAVRQGVSALLGTPQVATPIERASEIGLSVGMGAAGAAGGKALSGVGKKGIKFVKKAFPKLKISDDGLKLINIAKKEGLPTPTPGQIAGGDDLVMEKAFGHRRFFGRKVRQKTNKQIEKIKENLGKKFGDFVDTESSRADVGLQIKNRADEYIKTVKGTAGDLFKEVAEEAKDVGVDAKSFTDDLLKNFQKTGLFDASGNPLQHTSRTGMTEDAFEKTQQIFGKILKDLSNSGTDLVDGVITPGQKGQFIDANTLNTMRQFIDKNISEQGYGFDDVMLIKMKNHFMNVTESMLNMKDPALKNKFRTARNLWAKQLKLNNQFKKGGQKGLGIADINDHEVLRKVFTGKNQVKMLKEMTDDATAEKAGISYINDILTKRVGKTGQKGAQGAISSLKEKREALIEAVGEEKYRSLMDNLHYLNRVGESINPSQTNIIKMMSDLGPINMFSGAVDAAQYKGKKVSKNFIKSMEKFNKRVANRTRKAAIGLSDSAQRDASYLTRGPNSRVPQNKEEEK